MLKNGRNALDKLKANGCSCCNTKQCRRTARKTARRREEREWRREISK